VLVLGAGFIGCEVAASARGMGCEVVMMDIATPLARVLGERIGSAYAQLHRDRGVDVRIGESVVRFEGSEGRLEAAVLSGGGRIACELAVIGVGVAPATSYLDGQPIDLDNGIVVDELCQSSAPGVFAAGDVAHWWHPGYGERIRVEHFDNAQMQGAAAARSMLGKGEPYAPIPTFWSDQYDWRLQSAGRFSGHEEVVFRGRLEAGEFSAFYLKEGKIRGCLAVNRTKDLSAARRLMAAGRAVSGEQLADESVDLKKLAAGSSA
jgi:3-phenylpropionate/trans-cinnamate dioxygenase ferredoxin reductase subunit